MVALSNARTHRQRQAGRFEPPAGGAHRARLAGVIVPVPNIWLWTTCKDEQMKLARHDAHPSSHMENVKGVMQCAISPKEHSSPKGASKDVK